MEREREEARVYDIEEEEWNLLVSSTRKLD